MLAVMLNETLNQACFCLDACLVSSHGYLRSLYWSAKAVNTDLMSCTMIASRFEGRYFNQYDWPIREKSCRNSLVGPGQSQAFLLCAWSHVYKPVGSTTSKHAAYITATYQHLWRRGLQDTRDQDKGMSCAVRGETCEYKSVNFYRRQSTRNFMYGLGGTDWLLHSMQSQLLRIHSWTRSSPGVHCSEIKKSCSNPHSPCRDERYVSRIRGLLISDAPRSVCTNVGVYS